MAGEEKKPPLRLGGLSTGPGKGRLGGVGTGADAGASKLAGGAGPSISTATGARKMRFMPTNFARPKPRADSPSEGAPSTSVSVVSKTESVFGDLAQAAKQEAAWQRQGGRGRGGGRGASRGHTTFGGGAGEAGPSGGRRVWGGAAGAAADAGGGRGGGTRRLVKAGAKPKAEGGVKAEPTEGGGDKAGAGGGELEDGKEEWEELEEDPISYDQYYPTMLPFRQEGEPLIKEPDDPAQSIPKDLFDQPEDYAPLLEEMAFLQDQERNDGRIMMFQLPSVLPLSTSAPDGVPGTSAAGAATGRPAALRDLPSGRIGKLLVFKSGKVKMKIGDVLLDVDPGVPPRFRQDIALVSAASKQCVMLGPVQQRMVVTPNVDTLLDFDVPLPQWRRAPAGAGAGAAAAGDGAAAAPKGPRIVVGDSSDSSSSDDNSSSSSGSSEEEAEAMEVDEAAGNGAQPQAQQGQQAQGTAGRRGRQPAAVAVKREAEEEEVVSPRRGGGLRSPRGRAGGGVRSPSRGGVRSPKGGQKARDGNT